MKRNWTDKQEMFCQEYLVDLNATRAAVRAGYSAKTAHSIGPRLLENVGIQARIAKLKDERNERTQIDADYVLRQAVKLHQRCMQEVKPKTTIRGDQVCDQNGNALFVFNASGAAKALELIGKHVDVQAFLEKSRNEVVQDHLAGSSLAKIDTDTLREIRDILRKKVKNAQ